LLPDFFLDIDPNLLRDQLEAEGATPAFGGSTKGGEAPASGGPAKTFEVMQSMLSEDLVGSVGGVFQFNLTGLFTVVYSYYSNLFVLADDRFIIE